MYGDIVLILRVSNVFSRLVFYVYFLIRFFFCCSFYYFHSEHALFLRKASFPSYFIFVVRFVCAVGSRFFSHLGTFLVYIYESHCISLFIVCGTFHMWENTSYKSDIHFNQAWVQQTRETKEQLNQHNRPCEHCQREFPHIFFFFAPGKTHCANTLTSYRWKKEEKNWKEERKKIKHLIVVVHSPFICPNSNSNSNFKPNIYRLIRFPFSFYLFILFVERLTAYTHKWWEKEVFIWKRYSVLFFHFFLFLSSILRHSVILKSNGNERKISHSFGIIWLMHKQLLFYPAKVEHSTWNDSSTFVHFTFKSTQVFFFVLPFRFLFAIKPSLP